MASPVVIKFPPNPETDVASYNVYRSDTKLPTGAFTKIGAITHDANSALLTFTDTGGTEEDYYKLAAVNTSAVESLATDAIKPIALSKLTRLYDKILDAAFKPVVGIRVEARLDAIQAKYGEIIVPRAVLALTDSNGYWFMDLFPNSVLTPAGTKYIITIQGISPPKEIVVPSAQVVSYSSLITLP